MKKESVYMGTMLTAWMQHKNIKYVTFSVTDDCNLMCEYCYFTHKNNKNKMPIDIAKKAIDYILSEILCDLGEIQSFVKNILSDDFDITYELKIVRVDQISVQKSKNKIKFFINKTNNE